MPSSLSWAAPGFWMGDGPLFCCALACTSALLHFLSLSRITADTDSTVRAPCTDRQHGVNSVAGRKEGRNMPPAAMDDDDPVRRTMWNRVLTATAFQTDCRWLHLPPCGTGLRKFDGRHIQ